MDKKIPQAKPTAPGHRVLEGRSLFDWLSELEGNFRLIPSPEGLYVFKQLDSPRLAKLRGRVSICGEIEHLGELTDILNLVNTSRWSGDLHCISDPFMKTVSFKNGDVYNASSNSPEDRLGEVACRFGVITHHQLVKALEECPIQEKLGGFLIRKEMINTHDLYSLVLKQAEEIFHSLLLMSEGQFFFYREDLPENIKTRFLLLTQNLLLEGMQRIDEMSYFREKIPASTVVFERVVPRGSPFPLNEIEETVLGLIDGAQTLEQIAETSRYGEFAATKAAFKLLQTGWIRPRKHDRLGPKANVARQSGTYDIVHVFNEVFAQTFEEARTEARRKTLRQAASSFFDANKVYKDLFKGVTLKPDGTFDADKLIANLKRLPVDDRVDFVYQALDEFLFFETFVLGETLDEEALEQLHERIETVIRESSELSVK